MQPRRNVTMESEPVDLVALLDALELVLDPETLATLRAGTSSSAEKAAVTAIDTAIKATPGLSKPITLYHGYTGMPELRDGGELVEKAFFVGSTEPPAPGDGAAGDVVTLALAVPAGTPALRLNDAVYVLDRGLTLSLEPAKKDTGGPGALVPATMVPGPKEPGIQLTGDWATVLPVDGDWGTAVIEEFFNPFHAKDGRFGTGRGGGGGKGSADPAARTPEQQARKAKVIKIVAGIAAAALVVGAVALVLSGGKPPQPRGDQLPGHKGDEKTKSLEQHLHDQLASKEKHRGEAEAWVDGHKAKGQRKADLEHDAKQKVKDLKQKKEDSLAKAKADRDAKIKADREKSDAQDLKDKAAREARGALPEARRKKQGEAPTPEQEAHRERGMEIFGDADERLSDLNDAQYRSHFQYISNRYHETNGALRGKNETTPEVQGIIDGMDSVFATRSVSTGGATVYRGVKKADGVSFTVGEIKQDAGYLSTTASVREARKFAGDGGYELTIKTKADTRVIAGNEAHEELIGNRGLPLKITNVQHCPDGICRVDAEVV